MRRPGQQRDLMQIAAAVVGAAAAAQVVTGADRDRAASRSIMLDNHRVRRDGDVWLCSGCGLTWPHPAPLPDDAGPCSPRRWGDDE